jgi:hypothetical protein
MLANQGLLDLKRARLIDALLLDDVPDLEDLWEVEDDLWGFGLVVVAVADAANSNDIAKMTTDRRIPRLKGKRRSSGGIYEFLQNTHHCKHLLMRLGIG